MNALLTIVLGIVSLCGQWQFCCTSPEGGWLDGTVPGSVHTDLMAAGVIENPFYGDNEKRIQWIGEKDWEYRKSFELSSAELANSHVELVFEGIDTYATVFINGRELFRADNMFRTWKMDVKSFLHEGVNEIRVCFDSVFKIDIPKYLSAPYKLQAWPNNDQSDIWISLYARKAGYNYGWDWGPRLITSGLWKPVYLDCWSELQLKPSQIVTSAVDAKKASMKACVELMSDRATDALVEISTEGKTLYKAVRSIAKGENRLECAFDVRKPELWWTKALGAQRIYDFDIRVTASGTVAERTESTGIRTVEVVREKDAQGQSFYVRLNGVPVFMKGADWVPQDNFPTRVTEQRYASAIGDAVRANMNMLRVWGGGLYESDAFYEACDRAGILVWQDMAFACGMFPSDEAYLQSVAAEVRDNVSRLRNHPSLALWCGNNENEISYYGRWKPLQFYARRAYSELLVSPYLKESGETVGVRIVSDLRKECRAELEMKVMDFNGEVKSSMLIPVSLAADSSSDVAELPLSEIPEGCFVELRLLAGGRLLSENQYFPEYPNRYSYAAALPSVRAEDTDGGVALHISSESLIRGLMLSTDSDEDVFEDNCLTIVPGYDHTVNVKTQTGAEAFLAKLRYQSLNEIMR